MQLTDTEIRDIFMAHGFTIKDGQADLKPYVYAAARALLSASKPATTMGWTLVPDHADTDAIVTSLYRRFKDWNKRGFGPDEVTWCEVKADVLAMLAASPAAPPQSHLTSIAAESNDRQIDAAGQQEPVNGIPATPRHDEGAIARCSYCGRYSLDPKTLSDRQPKCECGEKHGWSGSFKKPGLDAKWSGADPVAIKLTQPAQSDIDALFARVTDWVTAHCIPFEAQNELFRTLAAFAPPTQPAEGGEARICGSCSGCGYGNPQAGTICTQCEGRGIVNPTDEQSIIRELQKALFYWMPRIAGEDSPAGQKAAEHAYLLVGLDDNSTECWGDQILEYVGIMNRQQEKLEIVLRDAGCEDEEDHIEFIEKMTDRAASPQPAAQTERALTKPMLETLYWSAMNNAADIRAFIIEANALLTAAQPASGAQET